MRIYRPIIKKSVNFSRSHMRWYGDNGLVFPLENDTLERFNHFPPIDVSHIKLKLLCFTVLLCVNIRHNGGSRMIIRCSLIAIVVLFTNQIQILLFDLAVVIHQIEWDLN